MKESSERKFELGSEEDTQRLAVALADVFQRVINDPETYQKFENARIYLHGDLGAGKTTFTRYFLREMGVKGKIKSPSYTLLESYKVSSLQLYHFDFYRFNSPDEWVEAGFQDTLFDDKSVTLIEWPEKAGKSLPHADLALFLSYSDNDGRLARLAANTQQGQSWLQSLNTLLNDAKF